MKKFILVSLMGLCLGGCVQTNAKQNTNSATPEPASQTSEKDRSAEQAQATFAAGCFWCIEPPFDKLKDQGVISTTVGYAGGTKANADYKKVSSGTTQHVEAIQVTYDPTKISYAQLLAVFWKNVDPFDAQGQFCDKGAQYVSAIYAHNDAQKKAAQASIQKLKQAPEFAKQGTLQTQVWDYTTFFPAEDYHQDYYIKNPLRYKFYRRGCGRDKRLQQVWSDLPNVL